MSHNILVAADGTIKDIQGLYKSLLHEYDYMVQDAWVSLAHGSRQRRRATLPMQLRWWIHQPQLSSC